MDSSHVSLISFLLRSDHFSTFRCDRNLTLGLKQVVVFLADYLKLRPEFENHYEDSENRLQRRQGNPSCRR